MKLYRTTDFQVRRKSRRTRMSVVHRVDFYLPLESGQLGQVSLLDRTPQCARATARLRTSEVRSLRGRVDVAFVGADRLRKRLDEGTSQNLKNCYDAAVAVNHNANAPTMTPNRNLRRRKNASWKLTPQGLSSVLGLGKLHRRQIIER